MPPGNFPGLLKTFLTTVETFKATWKIFPGHRGNFQGHLETFQTTVEIFYPESFCHLRSLHKHVPLEITILMQIYLFIVCRKYSMMGVVRMGVVLLPRQLGPHIGTRVQLGTFSEFGSSKGPHFFQGPYYLHFRLKKSQSSDYILMLTIWLLVMRKQWKWHKPVHQMKPICAGEGPH